MPMEFPSAAVSAPPIQYQDFLGQYLRGQMAPGALQEQQNTLQQQGLSLDQLRLAMRNQQAYQDVAFQQLRGQGYNVGGQGAPQPTDQSAPDGTAGAGAQSGASSTGGVQTGPQGSVSARTGPTQPNTGFNGSVSGFTPSTLGALAMLRGDDPLKTATGVQEYQVKQAQLQAQGPLDLIDSVFNSAAPARTVMANPSLMARWPQLAQQLGVDPVAGFNDQNVRAALALAGNGLRGSTGQPAKDYPVPATTVNAPYGQQFQVDPVTGKATQISGREMPAYTLEDRFDPATGHMTKVPVQTGGWGAGTNLGIAAGAGGPNAGGGGGNGVVPSGPGGNSGSMGSGTAGGTVPRNPAQAAATGTAPGIDQGPPKPTEENLKSATMAGYMRDSVGQLRQMEQSGYRMSPAVRTAVIDAATSDDPSTIKQFLSQETLAHRLSPDDQRYLTSLMPMLEAAGHSMAGARLTTSQMRTNFESMIPSEGSPASALTNINGSRSKLYNGLLAQSGSAAQLPEYKGTLGRDVWALTAPTTNAQGWALHKDSKGNYAYVSPDGKRFQAAGQ